MDRQNAIKYTISVSDRRHIQFSIHSIDYYNKLVSVSHEEHLRFGAVAVFTSPLRVYRVTSNVSALGSIRHQKLVFPVKMLDHCLRTIHAIHRNLNSFPLFWMFLCVPHEYHVLSSCTIFTILSWFARDILHHTIFPFVYCESFHFKDVIRCYCTYCCIHMAYAGICEKLELKKKRLKRGEISEKLNIATNCKTKNSLDFGNHSQQRHSSANFPSHFYRANTRVCLCLCVRVRLRVCLCACICDGCRT